MKKLLVLLGILAAFSFVACNKEADPVNPPASDPIENPTDTPDVPDTPAEIVLFDPANYDGDTIEIDGEKFAKLTVDGYNTHFPITAIDCSKYKKFTAKLAGAEDDAGLQLNVVIKDASFGDIATISMKPIAKEAKSYVKEGFDEKTAWNTVSETKIAANIQPMVQDTTAYQPQSGVVVYIGKIIAE